MHKQLTGSFGHRAFFVFFAWFARENPDVLSEGALADLMNRSDVPFSKKDARDFIENPELLGPHPTLKNFL